MVLNFSEGLFNQSNFDNVGLNSLSSNINNVAILLRRITNQTINNNLLTNVLYDQIVFQTDQVSYDGATGKVTILEDGVYLIVANASWASNATGYRRVHIITNPATWNDLAQNFMDASATGFAAHGATSISSLKAGTEIYCYVSQTSGGALNISVAATNFAVFQLIKVSL